MHRHALLIAILVCACSGDDDDPPSSGRDAGSDAGRPPRDAGTRDAGGDAATGGDGGDRPTSLFLEGTAEGAADADAGGGQVDCRFWASIEEIEYDQYGDFSGHAAGELIRTTLLDDGAFEFSALIGGPATLRHVGGDRVELRFVGDQPDGALPLWRELEVIEGRDRGDGHYAGRWRCAPGPVGGTGFMDIDLTVPGNWTLGPGTDSDDDR